jgi:enediyne polyketide synthase
MQSIAIVGMACRYPDARSPQELWENVLAQRRAFRKIPAERLNLDDYYHADRNTPDRTYSSQGAFLTDYVFDRERFRIAGKTYRSSDMTHWLALDVAEQALADAGFSKERALPTDATGVLVGNTLTGEFSRAQILRLRWPYVARVVMQALLKENWQPEAIQNFLAHLEQDYKRPFAPVNEETLAGGLSNTIAGRICNYFNLKGGGYTVDGACSSSLLAFIHACKALEAFEVDVALAGGVDLSIDPFEIIGFAKTSALAAEEMLVYDVHSHGFLPGEGCGFVVLMRYEDALEQNCRIYAVVPGWGISSDGSGGITRPEVEGQHLALTRAYRRSGFCIDTVSYFEGHGTGTEVGDTTELRALTFTLDEVSSKRAPEQKTPISSVKANIGHTKAASGIAGVIKATMALSHQIIPPATGVLEPHPELTRPEARIQVLRQGKIWPADQPLRAGISSMGFGGINTHIVLEGATDQRREALTPSEQQFLASFQDTELFLLSAPDVEALQEKVTQLLTFASRLSYAELTDLAAFLASNLQPGLVRAALIASKPAEFEQRLKDLQHLLATGVSTHIDQQAKIFLGSGEHDPRIAFLFPGQGSPAHLDGGILRSCFPEVDALYLDARFPVDTDGKRTEVAQPSITTASLAGLKVLEKIGVQAQVALGHSLGELSALHWAGAMDEAALRRLAYARGAAIAGVKTPSGAMLSIRTDAQAVRELIRDTPVVISGLNSLRQTVIAGDLISVNKIAARCAQAKIPCVRLAVSHAFHSPLVAPAVEPLAQALEQEHFTKPGRPLVSTVTGDFVEDNHIQALLCDQMTKPVRFLEAVERIQKDIDLFIEVGPGMTLTRLLPDITSCPVVATDAGGSSFSGILAATAAAFVLGSAIQTQALFAHRFTRPIDLNWNPTFLANPCEQAPLPGIERLESLQESDAEEDAPHSAQTTLEVLRQIIAKRTELPMHLLELKNRMLSDLHLNSITVGQILNEASRSLGISPSASLLRYADARLDEIVQTLDSLQQQKHVTDTQERREPDGLAPWVRCFSFVEQEQALSSPALTGETGDWQIIAPDGYALTDAIARVFASIKGVGALVCLPPDLEDAVANLLLQGAQSTLARQEATHFVLLQHGKIGAAFARTLSLEYPNLTVCVVHLPLDLPDLVVSLAQEVQAAKAGFTEARYDLQKKRTQSVFAPYLSVTQGEPLQLESSDVLLVSAGGKGIAAACAFALAEKTGVALALLGRSDPQQDTALAEHLARLDALGLRYRYFSIDVLDSQGVARVIEEIEASLGPVTALLHGAGVNDPLPLSLLDEEAMQRTLAPKVRGLQNLLASVSPQRLKYLITFGSVIARTGMPGEAHYALANEWLAHLTTAFQQVAPACACLCIEWSVWSGVGMGERLGSVEALRAMGILPIPVEEGTALFLDLLAHRQSTTRMVVSGRMGSLPTVTMVSEQLPFLRFLEKPLVFYPGIELITAANISTVTDRYLDDHQLQGERLVPAVVGLEAMAQVAMAVTGNQGKPAFTDTQFLRPLVIPAQSSATLRLLALVLPDGTVEVAIRSSETDYQVNHFQATCHFSSSQAELSSSLAWPVQEEAAIQLQPLDDMYGQILFHRGRFRRIQRYTLLHATECVAEITPYTGGAWFARYLPSQLLLGDPAQRDAMIHAIQACIPQATLIPVSVDRLVFTEQSLPEGQSVWIYARERSRQGNTFIYDLEARSKDGRVLEQWSGLHLQTVGATLPPQQWAEALLGPYCERRLAELSPQTQVVFSLSREADTSLKLDFHATDQVGSHLTLVRPRTRDHWNDLLKRRGYALAEQLAEQSREPFDLAATRVLAVNEILEKIADPLDMLPVLLRTEQDGWQMLEAGSYVLFTFVTNVRSQPQPVVFTFYHQGVTTSEQFAQILI